MLSIVLIKALIHLHVVNFKLEVAINIQVFIVVIIIVPDGTEGFMWIHVVKNVFLDYIIVFYLYYSVLMKSL